MASRAVFQMDHAAPTDQKFLQHIGERREGSTLGSRVCMRALRHHQQSPHLTALTLHVATGVFGYPGRENSLNEIILSTNQLLEDDIISNQLKLFVN